MSDDLHEALQGIDGIGPATATDIMDVLAEYDVSDDDPLLDKARAKAREGDDRKAAMYLRRATRDE